MWFPRHSKGKKYDTNHVERGHDSEDDEPEPEHDVDLLVDDVEGQHAHGVVPLDRAGGTVLVEGALRDPEEEQE